MSHTYADTTYTAGTQIDAELFDDPAIRGNSTRTEGDIADAQLLVTGISCSGCVHKIETALRAIDGVAAADINFPARRLDVTWQPENVRLAIIIRTLRDLGFDATPWNPSTARRQLETERKDLLKRLGVAGVFGMQVMTIAVAQYLDTDHAMDPGIRALLTQAALLLTLPVVMYSAAPLFAGAIRSFRNRQASMDLTVCLAISLAFMSSAYAAVTGVGETWFESVCMFVFLLTGTRLIEVNVRHRAAQASDQLANTTPALAYRVDKPGDAPTRQIPAVRLNIGDVVAVPAGDTVPADGVIALGQGQLSEAVVTGESVPLVRNAGESVIAGSIVLDQPIWLRVTETASLSTLSRIRELADRVYREKPVDPAFVQSVARWFIALVLLATALTIITWLMLNPANVVPATIAVLAVACPCAISLASPAAFSVTANRLVALRALPTRPGVVDQLSNATDIIFDKTGTLTLTGATDITIGATGRITDRKCMSILAGLESAVSDPLATAITSNATHIRVAPTPTDEIRYTPGAGVCGTIDATRWYAGNAEYLRGKIDAKLIDAAVSQHGDHRIWLSTDVEVAAWFDLEEHLVDGAGAAIKKLQDMGIRTHILSGDRGDRVDNLARELDVDIAAGGQTPDAKRQYVEELQKDGAVVAMIGDGINDSPAFSQADISVSVNGATAMATEHADLVLLSSDLFVLPKARALAQRTGTIIRQNLYWALGYNLVSIPLAAAAILPPWLAALGMSASSLIVIANSMRLHTSTS